MCPSAAWKPDLCQAFGHRPALHSQLERDVDRGRADVWIVPTAMGWVAPALARRPIQDADCFSKAVLVRREQIWCRLTTHAWRVGEMHLPDTSPP